MTEKRIDLHAHSLFSDGDLLPSEILRRAVVMDHGALAITDHADSSNMEPVLAALLCFAEQQPDDFPLTFIPGIELTHVAPRSIARLARRAKELGAGLVVVHGESPVEPVAPGTDRAAAECPDVDIIAHPGLITAEEMRLAAANDVYVEITSRKGHALANGHVARLAREAGVRLVVNTDHHTVGELITQAQARRVAAGAGLNEAEVEAATVTNPQALVQRALHTLSEV